MTPVFQNILYDLAADELGDCYRAALASILDLEVEALPHFGAGNPTPVAFNARIDAWMADQGLIQIWNFFDAAPLPLILGTCAHANPGICHLVVGRSSLGGNHACVACDGEIIHDPSPRGAGIVGPADDGRVWIGWLGSRRAKA